MTTIVDKKIVQKDGVFGVDRPSSFIAKGKRPAEQGEDTTV